jgi:hypothetical protein
VVQAAGTGVGGRGQAIRSDGGVTLGFHTRWDRVRSDSRGNPRVQGRGMGIRGDPRVSGHQKLGVTLGAQAQWSWSWGCDPRVQVRQGQR